MKVAYSRRRERLVTLEGLTLAPFPPDLRNVSCAHLENTTIRVGAIGVCNCKYEWRNELGLGDRPVRIEDIGRGTSCIPSSSQASQEA